MSMGGPEMTGSGLVKAAVIGRQAISNTARKAGVGLSKQSQSVPT